MWASGPDPGCQIPIAAPLGSVTTAMWPIAPMAIAGTTSVPPAAATAFSVVSMSSDLQIDGPRVGSAPLRVVAHRAGDEGPVAWRS